MNKATTDNAREFLEKNPTHIATVLGVDLYEHPEYGDESPLVAITSDGRKCKTDLWDVPSIEEMRSAIRYWNL